MFKKIIICIVVLTSMIVKLQAQANWNFVGPRSTNQAVDNKFETAQMTKVITSTLAPSVVFASSKYGGLWVSYTNGAGWYNVDMSPTGLSQALAISFKNANELLVGNFQGIGDIGDVNNDLSFSKRVSSYDFWNQTWTHYPLLPTGTATCVIKSVAVHPADQNVIYAATSIGLFRYDGSSWSHILTGCNLESIVFTDNSTCFVSGCNTAGAYPNYSHIAGVCAVYVSTNSGNTFFQSFTPNIPGYVDSHTEICAGAGGIFALTSSNNSGETRYLHKITKTGSVYTVNFYTQWTEFASGKGRMAITYDALNDYIWAGSLELDRIRLSDNNVVQGFNSCHMANGLVHSDVHGLCIDGNNNLWVACDGGIGRTSLTNTNSISFSAKNYGINVSMLHSFSGSEQQPNIYALGGQDIVNTDIYDELTQKNRYTHIGTCDNNWYKEWENDGAFIYKFNDSLMIMDASMYNHISNISVNRGQNIQYSHQQYRPDLTANAPFGPDVTFPDTTIVDGNEYGINRMEAQRTLQDPYRPGRIFQVGRFGGGGPAVLQYHFASKKMVYKFGFGPWGPGVVDISFSPQTKNSFYFITAVDGYASPTNIVKYIGPDIDDCWRGHNEHTYPDPNNPNVSLPQWSAINPSYQNFSSVGGGAVNFNVADFGKIFLKKIETSPWNKDIIYVAGMFGHPGHPATETNFQNVKVLKFNGTTWVNYSTGIPTVAVVFSMAMDHYSNDALYLSTTEGVYYRTASMTSWVPYTVGLQNIPVKQMEINYKENTVRVGTYGYGIWKSQLQCPSLLNMDLLYITPPGVYEAQTIKSYANNDLMHGPIALRGTKSVTLLPGFKAIPSGLPNNYLFAYIHGCGSGSSTSPYLYRSLELDEEFVENKKEELFTVFPNPSHGKYTLKTSVKGEYKVHVYNSVGALMNSFGFEGKEYDMNIENLKSGIYFLTIEANNSIVKTLKVIKE